MKKSLCYHCDEKWNPSHRCKTLKVSTLQGSEDVTKISCSENREEFTRENEMEETMIRTQLEISLHAITGTPHSSTMRLQAWIGGDFVVFLIDMIGGESIVFLIDSESTHNFVDSTLLPKLKLKLNV